MDVDCVGVAVTILLTDAHAARTREMTMPMDGMGIQARVIFGYQQPWLSDCFSNSIACNRAAKRPLAMISIHAVRATGAI